MSCGPSYSTTLRKLQQLSQRRSMLIDAEPTSCFQIPGLHMTMSLR